VSFTQVICVHAMQSHTRVDHKIPGLILLHVSNTSYKDNENQMLTTDSDYTPAGGKSLFWIRWEQNTGLSKRVHSVSSGCEMVSITEQCVCPSSLSYFERRPLNPTKWWSLYL